MSKGITVEPVEKLHKIDLEIVKSVIKVFGKYDLKYFMLDGMMPGTIRHGDSIPWDDDIDLGMLREDYEKFLKVAEDELPSHLQIVNYKDCLSYTSPSP